MFYKNDVNTVVFYKGNETYMNLVIDMDNICKLYQILLECI